MRPLIRISLTIILFVFLAASSFRSTAYAATPNYEPGQIVIKLTPSSVDDLLRINQTYGTITLAFLPEHPDIVLLQAPLGTNVETLVRVMMSDVRLLYAELNYINKNPEDGGTDRIYGWEGEDSSTMH